jgi:hypothetical protein
VVSPLEGKENELSEVNAAGGRVIVNEFVDLSSKREGRDDWMGKLEATSGAEVRGSSFLSEVSSLPSSISLRDEERGVHKPNEGVLAPGELLLGESFFAVAAAVSVATAVLSFGPRFRGR